MLFPNILRHHTTIFAGLSPGPPVGHRAQEVLLALGPFLYKQPRLLVKVLFYLCVHLCVLVNAT